MRIWDFCSPKLQKNKLQSILTQKLFSTFNPLNTICHLPDLGLCTGVHGDIFGVVSLQIPIKRVVDRIFLKHIGQWPTLTYTPLTYLRKLQWLLDVSMLIFFFLSSIALEKDTWTMIIWCEVSTTFVTVQFFFIFNLKNTCNTTVLMSIKGTCLKAVLGFSTSGSPRNTVQLKISSFNKF